MKAFTPTPKDLTLIEIMEYFSTDAKAREHLESLYWSKGPVCPRCKCSFIDRIRPVQSSKEKGIREGLYRCNDCRRNFTVTVGTIFESTHIPLRKWLIAWYLLCSSKKGISSLQLQRMLGLGSYRTALFMTHRIRHALKDPVFKDKLAGDVEVDETYVGGKGHRSFNPETWEVKTGWEKKTPVVSLVERDGTKRSVVMDKVTAKDLQAAIRDHVATTARVHTDDSRAYLKVSATHEHHAVNHSKKEYAIKKDGFVAHTNTVESSFSLLKRGVYGTFHHVSRKHLPLYLAEFDHRWNTRKDTDGERTIKALKKAPGKRLTYKPLTNQPDHLT